MEFCKGCYLLQVQQKPKEIYYICQQHSKQQFSTLSTQVTSNNHCESNNKAVLQQQQQHLVQQQRPLAPPPQQEVKMPSSEKKAAKTLSAILFVFLCTWLPYELCQVYSASCDDFSTCIPSWLWNLSYYLCYINSTINPFCYALCNKTFRQTFIQILTCNKKRPKAEYDYGLPTKHSNVNNRSMNHYQAASSSSSSQGPL